MPYKPVKATANSTMGELTEQFAKKLRYYDRPGLKYYDVDIPNWKLLLITPIAKAIKRILKKEVEVHGPHGLSCAVHISFGDNVIVFVPGNLKRKNSLRIRDYTKNTGEYEDGSIGDLNGFNHPLKDIPKGMTIRELSKMSSF